MRCYVKARAECGCVPVIRFELLDEVVSPRSVVVDSLTFCRVHARPRDAEELAVLLQDANDHARQAGLARQRAERELERLRSGAGIDPTEGAPHNTP